MEELIVLEMSESDILQRLYDLDEDISFIYTPDIRFRLIIVGGGALLLRGIISRVTSDIDVLQADRRLIALMEVYDINCRVNAYENNFPYNYEDRIELVWSGKNIDYYTASLEDIIIAKLCAGRPEDLDDIRDAVQFIDWVKLELLAKDKNELRLSLLSDNMYYNFLGNYEEFERRYRPCKN
jgi:hypothetical protein